MDKNVTLDVLDEAGGREPWDFRCTQSEDRFYVTACGPAGVERQGAGDDWFDALRELRLVLEGDGLRPLCVGAMVNAHQSGMLAGSSEGSVAYLLRRRHPPKEVARIFDRASAEDTGTVAEQEAFFEAWATERRRYRLVGAATGLFREYWHRLRYR